MPIDLDHVLYTRARWRKTILVPLWTFQVAVLLCLMAVFAYRLAETFEHYKDSQKMGQIPMVEVVWEATNVGFNLISLVLNILEIARKATERLTPFFMICTHIIKLTLALAVLALDIVAYLQGMDGHYSTIGLSLDCGLLASTIVTFIYALVTYRRLLKYEDYHLTAASTKPHPDGGGRAGGVELELGHKHSVSHSVQRVSTQFYNREYDSVYPSQTRWSQTQADLAYRSPSAASLRTQIDRAISNEFGWGGDGIVAGSNSNPVAAVGRSGTVVVASGRVSAHHGMVAAEVHRAHSWRVEEAGEEDIGTADARADLVSPIEEAVGDEGRYAHGKAEDEDREALLPGK